MELNNLSVVRRRKKVTAKYETLQDLCEAFDNFSEPERKLNLFKYLGLFSTRDAIPDQYYEDPLHYYHRMFYILDVLECE